jgi:chondroitin AC lyase
MSSSSSQARVTQRLNQCGCRSRPAGRCKLAIAAGVAVSSLIHARVAHADDLGTISQRVTSQLLSSLPSTSTVQNEMNTLQSNGSWTDIDYSNTAQTNWVPLTHLQRMDDMSKLYSAPSSSLYHNATLGADLSKAFDYWISANPMSTNWFDNDIAAPQALGGAMVLISNQVLSPAQISQGQTILGRAKANIPSQTGQNVVDEAIAGIYSAIVSGSSSDMASAFGSIGGTITVVAGNGIQKDYTYQFHGPQLYMGGYGSSYVNDTLQWSAIGAGTSYAITDTQEHLLVDYLLNGTQWFIRGRTVDLTADGRQVTFPSYVGAGTGYVGAINNALALSTYRNAELQTFLARQQATISSGQASSTQNTMSGNRDFFNSEIMVQQRPGYYASVKVVSTRTSQPETGNNQGLENLYLGDGVNQIMVTGNEYLGIQPSWNWRRLPGTTVEQDTRSLTPPGTFGATKGTTDYAGGVSDGTYGAEAFNYNRFDVQAKKSWFFFDSEEAAMGAAIHSTSTQYEIDTTVNQCLLTSTVSYETTGGGVQTLATGNTVSPTGLKWVYQGGVGYFFPTPVNNATISAVAQSGTWSALNTAASSSTVTQTVFTLYLNHGTAVNSGSYMYIAVPGITSGGMDAYLAANPIQVLRNDANVQAVRQATLDVTQAAFYAADSFAIVSGQTLAASAPSAVMLQRSPNVLKLSAGSPQALSMALQLTLSGVTLSGGSPSWFDALGNATATFNLPSGLLAGSSVGVTLSSNGNATTPTVTLSSNDQVSNSTYTATAAVALPGNTTFSTDGFSTLAFTNIVSGSASITKIGAGTLALSGANTFNGGLTINAGTVRATSNAALGSGTVIVNPGGTLVTGASATNPITLSGGTLAFTGSPSMSNNLTAAAGSNSTIEIFDPQAQGTPINVSFTGQLLGSGNLTLLNATGTQSPDGGQAFRINGANSSTFSGTITLANNVKGELFGTTSGVTTPAGMATMVLTAGDATLGGTLNAVTTTGGYSELNLRNNTSGNQTYGNNVQVTGSGWAILNPLGTAAAGASVTLGNLRIGTGQTLGVYLSSSFNTHPVIFQSVTLTGGNATFAPKPNGFGASNSTGADLYLGSINESTAGSGITMAGLRTLFLTGANTYTGDTNVTAGTLWLSSGASIASGGTVNVSSGAAFNVDGSLSASATIYANGPVNFAGNTGNTVLNRPLAALNLGSGVTVTVTASNNAMTPAVLQPTTLTFPADGTGKINLTNNELITHLPLSSVQTKVTGGQIFTTTSGGTLGAIDLGNGNTEVRFTLLGDTNLDGQVNVADLANLAGNFGVTGGASWIQGDFDRNGAVNVADLADLAGNFGGTLDTSGGTGQATANAAVATAATAAAVVPEPVGASALAIAAAAALLLRRGHPPCAQCR